MEGGTASTAKYCGAAGGVRSDLVLSLRVLSVPWRLMKPTVKFHDGNSANLNEPCLLVRSHFLHSYLSCRSLLALRHYFDHFLFCDTCLLFPTSSRCSRLA